MEDIILLGFGGHAKSVVDTIEQQGKYKIAGFLERPEEQDKSYRGYQVIGVDADAEKFYREGIRNAFVTVGSLKDCSIRRRLYRMLKEIGFTLPVIIDSSASLATDVTIGEGTYVGKNAAINAEAQIGNMVILNTGSIIEHECVVGDFTHVAVGAVACGGVTVGHSCLIGANATIIQECNVGDNTVIGAGTTLRRSIGENQIYYGAK